MRSYAFPTKTKKEKKTAHGNDFMSFCELVAAKEREDEAGQEEEDDQRRKMTKRKRDEKRVGMSR